MLRPLALAIQLLAACFALAPSARAEDAYPSRLVRIVVGAAAGGITDVVARLLGDYITRTTGAQVVVDNIGGAGGNIAFAQVAKAPPDGYTIGLATAGNITSNPFLYKNMPFNPLTDLAPVAPICTAPQLLIVDAASDIRTFGDLVSSARAHPGAINYGSAGVGTTPHLSAILFEKLANIELTHVPYRGMAPAITDLVAGRLQMLAIGAQPVASFIRDGKLRPLAVTDAHRLPGFPEVPTTAEAGLPGYEVSSWYGLFVTKNTPPAVIGRMNAIVRGMLADEVERKKLTDAYFVPLSMTPPEYRALVDADAKLWGGLIRERGLAVD